MTQAGPGDPAAEAEVGQRLAKVITATLGREAPQALQAMARGLQRIPGMASPDRSGPIMASIVLDDRWAHLRDGAYVVIDQVDEQPAFTHDRERELRQWDATGELLEQAAAASV